MEAKTAALSRPSVGLFRGGWALFVTLLLAGAAAIYQGHHLFLATQRDDTNHLETPLALAVARELQNGPGGLFGPYSGGMPLVLVHAPLYYRLAALAAWPLARAGVDPLDASLAAGRLLSLVGLLLCVLAAGKIAVLDGLPAWAAVWSGLLVVGSPIVGSMPLTVRADMLGVGLQALGVALALESLRDGIGRGGRLAGAYVAFALAFCVKQHAVASLGVTSLLVVLAWGRGRARLGPIVAAHLLGFAVVGAYYGMEEWLTSGRMHLAAFILPSRFGRIAPASWEHVAEVAVEAAKRSAGLLALGVACVLASPRRALGGRVDAALWIYLASESTLAAVLCRGSTGSWVNYFMPSVILAGILVGRALARIAAERTKIKAFALIAIGLVAVLARDAHLAYTSWLNRAEGQAQIRLVLDDPALADTTPDQRYFVGLPNVNRLHGNAALTHDEWLYQQFERAGDAEPRDAWLREALARGPVRAVVVPLDGRRDADEVPGLTGRLPALGYTLSGQAGSFCIWTRPGPAGEDGASHKPSGPEV